MAYLVEADDRNPDGQPIKRLFSVLADSPEDAEAKVLQSCLFNVRVCMVYLPRPNSPANPVQGVTEFELALESPHDGLN